MISQSFAYEKKENGAVILRCFSRDGKAEIPEQIEGLPVRELAPYAFSAHQDKQVLPAAFQEKRLRAFSPVEGSIPAETVLEEKYPALSGESLEELVLPTTVSRVGKYCFYNCSHLRRLEFSGELYDWGSGAFTGCHQVEELCVHLGQNDCSSLKQVLDELPEELLAEMYMDGKRIARLIFPEFYEEGVENTPARILETHVHGSGILYRNCFQGRKMNFEQYDALFPHACAQENTRLLTELVLGRLRCPYRLGEKARKEYEEFVQTHVLLFGKYFLDAKDSEGLLWFLECFGTKRELLKELSEYAIRTGDAQAQSRLMDFQRKNIPAPARRKRLEL
ncbi:MAG: leucine-rich repeat domain-containing protein [Lachnospiraceae bacterium]|nr:leucine-rich repeat domain-containing protein [Lachnospiraceae bacterium]